MKVNNPASLFLVFNLMLDPEGKDYISENPFLISCNSAGYFLFYTKFAELILDHSSLHMLFK